MAISTASLAASANIVLGTVSTTTVGKRRPDDQHRRHPHAGQHRHQQQQPHQRRGAASPSTAARSTSWAVPAPAPLRPRRWGHVIVFNAGHSTIRSTAGAGGSVVMTANLVSRNPGATANLVAGGGQTLGSAANQFLINVPAIALLTNGIIKGFTVTDAATPHRRCTTLSTWPPPPAVPRRPRSPPSRAIRPCPPREAIRPRTNVHGHGQPRRGPIASGRPSGQLPAHPRRRPRHRRCRRRDPDRRQRHGGQQRRDDRGQHRFVRQRWASRPPTSPHQPIQPTWARQESVFRH